MKAGIRTVLMIATVGLVSGVALLAAALNPPGTRAWLVCCGVLATGTAVQAVTSEPRDLIPALLFALLPVAGLAPEGAPSWPGVVFAGLLLIAGELSALAWEGPLRASEDGSLQTRLQEAAVMAAAGLGVAALLGVLAGASRLRGTGAVVTGSVGLLGLAFIVFPRVLHHPSGRGSSGPE
jgi:hypothetical protein